MEQYLDTPLWDGSLTEKERLDYLLEELTLEEKFLCLGTGNEEIPRLGIPRFGVGGEGAHGIQARKDQEYDLGSPVPTTIFPNPIGMSATWDEELIREAGAVVGNEARGLYQSGKHGSLCLWAPTVDMERDPRWGRTEEGYGEDPYLAGKMAGAYVDGMQGDDSYYLRSGATLKHFYANNVEEGRTYISSTVDLRNKYEYYLEPFRCLAQEHHAVGMMTAYNEVNGVPAMLLKDDIHLLKKWGIQHVVCDGGDVSQTVDFHKYFSRHSETIAAGLEAGIDCFTDNKELVSEAAKEAYERGMITEEQMDEALRNYFRVMLRLGFFDHEKHCPYAGIGMESVGTDENHEIVRKITAESTVLLKNDGILPLRAESFGEQKETLAVIGPLSQVWFKDWYSGVPPYSVSPAQGIRNVLSESVLEEEGVSYVKIRLCDREDGFLGILADGKSIGIVSAEQAETFRIDFWGNDRITLRAMSNQMLLTTCDDVGKGQDGSVTATKEEAFGWFVKEIFHLCGKQLLTWDRKALTCTPEGKICKALETEAQNYSTSVELVYVKKGIEAAVETAKQADQVLLFLGPNPMINCKEEIDRTDIRLPEYQEELLRQVCSANRNVVLVLVSSVPFDISFAKDHVPGILLCASGSMELGNGLADVIFGKTSPAGRLNMTWYQSVEKLPEMNDYDIIQGERTYQYFEGEVLYPFGYGLTYSELQYEDLQICREKAGVLKVSLVVCNQGAVMTDDVVQVYVRKIASEVKRARKTLVAFRRVKELQPGERRRIQFEIAIEQFRYFDVISEEMLLEGGEYEIMVGASSEEILLREIISLQGTKRPRRIGSQVNKAECFDVAKNYVLQPGHLGYTAVCSPNATDRLELHFDKMYLENPVDTLVLDFWKEFACSIRIEADGKKIGSYELGSPTQGEHRQQEAGEANGDGAFEAHQNWLTRRREIGYTELRIPVSEVPAGKEFTLTIQWQGQGKLCTYHFE